MKKWTMALLFLVVGGLAGCQEPTSPLAGSSEAETSTTATTIASQTNEASKSTTSMTASESPTAASSTVEILGDEMTTTTSTREALGQREPLWDEEKTTALASFMNVWGASMDQQYQSYRPSQPTDLYGVLLPDAILSGDWQMAVAEQPVNVAWSEDGRDEVAYQLVAVYSDIAYARQRGTYDNHVYFFVIHEGQPQVYITQQNQGNAENYLYFSETQNAELRQGFTDIFNTGSTSLTDNLQDTTTKAATSAIIDLNSAYEYLKEKDGNNPDLVYSDMGEGTDGYGRYWEIKVASQSMQAEGGTGTLARVKVYEDGVLRDAMSGDVMGE